MAPELYSRVKKIIDLEFSYENCRLSALLIRSITLTYDLADPVQWALWLEELRGIMHDMYDRASHYTRADTSIPIQIHVWHEILLTTINQKIFKDFYFFSAIISISTSAPFGRLATPTVDRDGVAFPI